MKPTARTSAITRRALLAGAGALAAVPTFAQVPLPRFRPETSPETFEGTGPITEAATGRALNARELIDRLAEAPIVLIGERHGYQPHQERTAFVLQALADRGRYPTLALEMLEPLQSLAVEAYRRRNPEYARGLAAELDWASSGWPAWHYYEPIFEAAFAAKLPVRGIDMPESEQDRILAEGIEARPAEPAILDYWRDNMRRAHRGLIDDERVERLALLQWRRDVGFAEHAAAVEGPVVVLVGRAHLTRSWEELGGRGLRLDYVAATLS